MKLYELLRVEGTDRYEVICFLLFPAGSIGTAVEACRRAIDTSMYQVTGLSSDGWPNEVVVVEATFYDPELVPRLTLDSIDRAFAVNGCRAAVCMLDGAFCEYDDIFSPAVANLTYAFCVELGSAVFCASGTVRAAEGWRSIIVEHQRLVHLT